MKSSLTRGLVLATGFMAAAGAVHAHPGHDGHELTWDLSHLADHPLATICSFAVVIAIGWSGWLLLRRGATQRVQSLRASHASRGK